MHSTGQIARLEVSAWEGDVTELEEFLKESAIQRPKPVVAPMANSWFPAGPNSRKRLYVLEPLGVWDRDGKLTKTLADAATDDDMPTPSCSLVASTCHCDEQFESSVNSATGNSPINTRAASSTSITLAHMEPLSTPATPGLTPPPPPSLSSWSFAPAGRLEPNYPAYQWAAESEFRNPTATRTPFARKSDPSLMYTAMASSVAPATYPFIAPTCSSSTGNQLLIQPHQPFVETSAMSRGVSSQPAGARGFHGVGQATAADMFMSSGGSGAGAPADPAFTDEAYLQMWQSSGPVDEDMVLLPPMCTLTNGLDSLPEPGALAAIGSLEYRPSAWISSVSFTGEERSNIMECSRVGIATESQGSRGHW